LGYWDIGILGYWEAIIPLDASFPEEYNRVNEDRQSQRGKEAKRQRGKEAKRQRGKEANRQTADPSRTIPSFALSTEVENTSITNPN
jgi:hypothetical protein